MENAFPSARAHSRAGEAAEEALVVSVQETKMLPDRTLDEWECRRTAFPDSYEKP